MQLRRPLPLAVGLLAALPILVAAVYAVVDHWTAIGDDAFIGIRAYDVFTGRSPLVGQRSSGASDVLSETVYSPGPLLFWLFAIPVRLPDPIFMTLTSAVVNVAAVAGTVLLALRRGGVVLLAATAVAIPVMLASLPAETYADVWNSSAPLMPLMLLVFLGWSIACGEYRLLPLAVLVASFEVQAHLTFVAPVAAVLLVALVVGLALGSARRWPRRWVLAAVLVGAVCWTPPVLDEIFNEPGNLGTLIDSASSGDRTLGWDSGWKAVVHTVGVPPWWLRDDPTPLERIGDLTVTPGAFAIATAAALLLLAAVLTAIGWRRRRPDLAAAGGLALLLPLAAGLAASSTPVKSFATVGYTLRWTSPVGMCVWLLAGWGAATLLAPRMRVPRAEPRIATVAVVALVAIVGVAVAIGENPPRREAYKPMRGLAHRLDEVIPASGGTRIVPASSAAGLGLTNELEAGSVFWLRRHGKPVVTTRNVADRVGSAYAKGSYERVLRLFVDVPPEPGGRVIARFPVVDEIDQKTIHTVTVTLAER